MDFYLGTHKPRWLSRTSTPLFVSRRTLAEYKRALPVALGRWALDSGGFSELSLNGTWDGVSPEQYAAEACRYRDEIGGLDWCAIQDWMCEPFITNKTGLTVRDHQQRTVDSYLKLHELAPDIAWAPVLQGWHHDDYLACVRLYEDHGVDLHRQPVVGVGSVCRRQAMPAAVEIFRTLAGLGLSLHGFGVKILGLRKAQQYLASADSLAWSYDARRGDKSPWCASADHTTCANCLQYALEWRGLLLTELLVACPECGSDELRPDAGEGETECVGCGYSFRWRTRFPKRPRCRTPGNPRQLTLF